MDLTLVIRPGLGINQRPSNFKLMHTTHSLAPFNPHYKYPPEISPLPRVSPPLPGSLLNHDDDSVILLNEDDWAISIATCRDPGRALLLPSGTSKGSGSGMI